MRPRHAPRGPVGSGTEPVIKALSGWVPVGPGREGWDPSQDEARRGCKPASFVGGRAGTRLEAPAQGMIRWTGLPLMLTSQVVVSLAALISYSIFHQPASVSPGGVRPPEP